MTGKIEITPEELYEIVKAQVADALAAERNPKPVPSADQDEADKRARLFDAEERAKLRETLAIEGARWAVIADEAIEAADHELVNPRSQIVNGLTVQLPSSGTSVNHSRPDLAGVAAGLMELQAQRNPEFAADANSWFRLGLSDLYRRPAIFRSLVEQRIRRRGTRAAEAADYATPPEQPENTNPGS